MSDNPQSWLGKFFSSLLDARDRFSAAPNLRQRVIQSIKPKPSKLQLLDQSQILAAAQLVVTPFTGFMLSQHYISPEVDRLGLTWLNPLSRRLTKRNAKEVSPRDIIYCQVDKLREFQRNLLPHISSPFILISGKWHLPGLEDEPYIGQILQSPHLVSWFSQNQVLDNRSIHPFPYGVRLEDAPKISQFLFRVNEFRDRQRTFVPFATIHDHLDERVRNLRVGLKAHMAPWMPTEQYLEEIFQSQFVLSPPGDRPDTYRHWEIVALGAIPISTQSDFMRDLFSRTMYFSDDLIDCVTANLQDASARPNVALATVEHWRGIVLSNEK